jgi:hypothetical protein
VEVVILEKDTLAGIPRRESEAEAIAATSRNSRWTEAVAVRLDVNLTRPRRIRADADKPCRNDRTSNQDEQGRKASAGFGRMDSRLDTGSMGVVPENRKHVANAAGTTRWFDAGHDALSF